MRRSTRIILQRYGLAAFSSAAALAATLALNPRVELLSPFLLFYAAVALSSWYGGRGPGLVPVVVGASSIAFFVLHPSHSFDVAQPTDLGRLILFVMVGALIAVLNGQLRDARALCQAEATAARVGEAKAKRLAESNLIAVFFSDLVGQVRWGNDAFLRLVDGSHQDLEDGRLNWRQLTVPEHRSRDDRALDELRRCRFCTPFEKEYLRRDGMRMPVLMGCAMLDDSDHEFVAFVVDLSQLKRAEAQVQAHQARLQQLARELMRAEERERRRIAVVLHDSISASLALAKRHVESLRSQITVDGAVESRLGKLYGLLDDAVQRTRSLTSEISPPVLYELGLVPALRWLCDRFEQQNAIECTVEDDEQPKPLSNDVRLVLFQAVRELFLNVAKHARASSCRTWVAREGDSIRLDVEDDGVGFDPAGLTAIEGAADRFGLFNIRERLSQLGGSTRIDSSPGQGARITLTAPLNAAKDATVPASQDPFTSDQRVTGATSSARGAEL
jgi:PAS domain S-box-containing protein